MLSLSAELQLAVPRIDGTELLDAMVTSVFLLDQELHVEYLNAAAANPARGRTQSSARTFDRRI